MNLTDERARREKIWQTLLKMAPDQNATTTILAEAGIRPLWTGQGIFRDHANTSTLAAEGVTLTLLDTGTIYDDAFDDDAGEYHYPATRRSGSRDDNEINATKNACRFGLPVFVILRGSSAAKREVRRGWIETWDDDRRVFLVSFLEPREQGAARHSILESFALISNPRTRRDLSVTSRPGQARFRYNVLSRCGGECIVCQLRVDFLLEAAHVCSIKDGGTDDPRNGIALCRNHHRAFDAPMPLFGFDPETLTVVARAGYTLEQLRISRDVLSPEHAPHIDALRWAWARFQRVQ